MTSSEPETGATRELARWIALGALAWAAFAVLYLALTPLVVDETALSAQILTGAVSYPAGHPHEVFHLQAFSLPNHLSAAILWFTDSVDLVSRARNFLVVFLSGFGPFLVAVVLSRRPLVGFAASALVLSDALYRFQGVYPTFVFPTFYSHGHVGAWVAVITVGLLAGGLHRTGGFLLGLAPAIHPLLGVLVWLWATAGGTARRVLARSALPFALGVLVSGASWWLSRSLVPDAEPVELYTPGDAATGELVRSQFIEFTDPHRRLPEVHAGVFKFGYASNLMAFVATAAVLLAAARQTTSRGAARALVGFVALAWAVVWGARAFELVVGELPDAAVTAMPYRLSNVSAILLVPLSCAALVMTAERISERALALAVLGLSLIVLAGGAAAVLSWSDPDAARFRLASGLLLIGAVLGAGVVGGSARSSVVPVACALGLLGLFLHMRFESGFEGVIVLTGGLLVTAIALGLARSGPVLRELGGGRLPLGALLAFACLSTTGVSVGSDNAEPSSLVTWFDEELDLWLDLNAEPDELVLPPLIPRTQIQAKTGHPVLLELGTLWLMPYLPGLSTVIGRMTRDLYGVDYGDRAALELLAGEDDYLGQHDTAWKDVWRGRRRAEWRALGEEYGFRLVVAPTTWNIDLVPEIVNDEWTLYRIPGV